MDEERCILISTFAMKRTKECARGSENERAFIPSRAYRIKESEKVGNADSLVERMESRLWDERMVCGGLLLNRVGGKECSS
jgi:hypothetical protein